MYDRKENIFLIQFFFLFYFIQISAFSALNARHHFLWILSHFLLSEIRFILQSVAPL